MKKKYFLYLYLIINIFILTNSVIANTGGEIENPNQKLQEQFEMIKKQNYLNQIRMYFWDEKTQATPKDYTITLTPGEKKQINLIIKNEAERDLQVRIAFSNQTKDALGNKACETEYSKGFKKFITPHWEENIIVPAQSKKKLTFTIKIPEWIQGTQKGCIAYGVKEDQKTNPGALLSIITRKTLYLTTLVGGTGTTKYQIEIGKLTKIKNQKGNLELFIPIQNVGKIPTMIDIQGEIKNFLGYEKKFIATGQIYPGKEETYKIEIENLPFYKGIFAISTKIKHYPNPNLEIDANLKGEEKIINMRHVQGSIRIRSILFILILGGWYSIKRK